MARMLVPSSSPYEDLIGFSRAVRAGSLVVVGGTAPIADDGTTVGVDDPAAQAHRCFEIIEAALREAGASLRHVVRTRTMLARIEDWEVVSEVRARWVGEFRPADTVVEVSRFIDPTWLVEIEAEAVID